MARYHLIFERPITFFVLPEVPDAAAYSKDLFDRGWLKVFAQDRDPFESHLMLTKLIADGLRHFVLVGRHEVVHVVSGTTPEITKETIVNGQYR
ncbi:MAG: hypothetical protein H0W44_08155 [Gammaproteobacteria bacterium]|nr:hypothetical protein [Gammaproteobacteria bacterium]